MDSFLFSLFFSLYIVFKLGSKIVGERDRWHIWKCNTWDSVGILAGLSEVFDGRGIMGGRSISQDQFRGKEERILVRRSRRSTCDYSYDLRRWLVRVALWVYIRAEIGGVNADSSQTSDGFSRMVWFSVCSLSLSLSLSLTCFWRVKQLALRGGVLRISIAILRGLAKDCRLVLFQIWKGQEEGGRERDPLFILSSCDVFYGDSHRPFGVFTNVQDVFWESWIRLNWSIYWSVSLELLIQPPSRINIMWQIH